MSMRIQEGHPYFSNTVKEGQSDSKTEKDPLYRASKKVTVAVSGVQSNSNSQFIWKERLLTELKCIGRDALFGTSYTVSTLLIGALSKEIAPESSLIPFVLGSIVGFTGILGIAGLAVYRAETMQEKLEAVLGVTAVTLGTITATTGLTLGLGQTVFSNKIGALGALYIPAASAGAACFGFCQRKFMILIMPSQINEKVT